MGTLIAALVLAAATSNEANARCLTCHGMRNLAVREAVGSTVRDFSIGRDAYVKSAHGSLACRQCHQEIDAYPHTPLTPRAKVTCAQDCHARDDAGHPYTHAAIAADFELSAHRARSAGSADRPTCVGCHGGDAHALTRAKDKSPRERMAMCAGCHDDRPRMTQAGVATDAVASYRRSFHYKAITFGARHAASCQDCHTAHRILSPSDPRSSVAPAALSATCGQAACHPGARTNFAVSGANHLDLRVKREPVLWLEEQLFLLLTVGTMAMLVAGIVLDIQKKFGWPALAVRLFHAARARATRWTAPRSGRGFDTPERERAV